MRKYQTARDAREIQSKRMLTWGDRLRLRIFRGLGFLPSKSTDATDEWSTLLVRSDTRNSAIHFDIHTAHLKQNEISPLVLADQLWKAAE
jgi:kinetochore protein Spc24